MNTTNINEKEKQSQPEKKNDTRRKKKKLLKILRNKTNCNKKRKITNRKKNVCELKS